MNEKKLDKVEIFYYTLTGLMVIAFISVMGIFLINHMPDITDYTQYMLGLIVGVVITISFQLILAFMVMISKKYPGNKPKPRIIDLYK